MARRTVLFSPGNRPSLLDNAATSGADVIVYDLEDGVGPEEKSAARETIQRRLADPDHDPTPEVCVRLNPIGIAADDDLSAILDGGSPDCVMLPKVSDADDIVTLRRLLDENGVTLPIIALIETASGVLNAQSIAAARGTTALAFGGEDLTADIGATRTEEGLELLTARQQVVLAASAANIDALDTVYTDLENLSGLREEAAFAAQLGFDGKLAIHPNQIEPIESAFQPDQADIEWAQNVMAAHSEHNGEGVFRVNDEMIDAPLIRRAEQILDKAGDEEST